MSRDPDDVYLTPCAEGASGRPTGTPRPAECWWSETRFIGRVRLIMARKAAASKRRGGAARKTTRKSTSRRRRPGASRRTTTASPRRRWSHDVTEHSDALTLESGVFTSRDPRRIAASLKRSAERSRRRKADPFRSALSMLTFYINRAGKNLPAARKKILMRAKDELRKQLGKD